MVLFSLCAAVLVGSLQDSDPERLWEALRRNPRPGPVLERWAQGVADVAQEEQRLAAGDSLDRLLLAHWLELRAEVEPARRLHHALRSPELPGVWSAWSDARLCARRGRLEEAIESAQMALSGALPLSEHVELLRRCGEWMHREGREAEVVAHWLRLLQRHPDDLLLGIDAAESLQELGLVDAAREQWQSLARATTDPAQRHRVELELGRLEAAEGWHDEARERWRSALAGVDPDSWQARELLRCIEDSFRDREDPEGLLRFLEQRLERDPGDDELRRRLAALAAEFGQPERGEACLEDGLRLEPRGLALRRALVRARIARGAENGVESVLQDWQRVHPEDAEPWSWEAEWRITAPAEDGVDRALAAWAAAAERDPRGALGIADAIARCWPRSKANDDRGADLAIRLLEDQLEREPERVELYDSLAAWFARREDRGRLVELLDRLVAQGSAEHAARAAMLAQRHEQDEVVARFLQLAVERDPASFDHHARRIEWWFRREGEAELRAALEELGARELTLAERARLIDWRLRWVETFSEVEREFAQAWPAAREQSLPAHERSFVAELALRVDRPDVAVELLDEALLDDPTNVDLARRRAGALIAAERLEEAATSLWAMSFRFPRHSVELLSDLIRLHLDFQQAEEALEPARQLLRRGPPDPERWLLIARVHQERGDHLEAARLLELARRSAPEDLDIGQAIAFNWEAAGERERALEAWWGVLERRLRARESAPPEAAVDALYRLASGPEERAELQARIDRRVQREPEAWVLAAAAARFADLSKDVPGAVDRYAVLHRLRPDDLEVLRILVRLDVQIRELDRACDWQRRIVERAPDDEAIRRLAELCALAGRVAESVTQWRRLAEEDGGVSLLAEAIDQRLVQSPSEAHPLASLALDPELQHWSLLFRLVVVATAVGDVPRAREATELLLARPLPELPRTPVGELAEAMLVPARAQEFGAERVVDIDGRPGLWGERSRRIGSLTAIRSDWETTAPAGARAPRSYDLPEWQQRRKLQATLGLIAGGLENADARAMGSMVQAVADARGAAVVTQAIRLLSTRTRPPEAGDGAQLVAAADPIELESLVLALDLLGARAPALIGAERLLRQDPDSATPRLLALAGAEAALDIGPPLPADQAAEAIRALEWFGGREPGRRLALTRAWCDRMEQVEGPEWVRAPIRSCFEAPGRLADFLTLVPAAGRGGEELLRQTLRAALARGPVRGEDPSERRAALWTFLQHAPDELLGEVLPWLREELRLGSTPPSGPDQVCVVRIDRGVYESFDPAFPRPLPGLAAAPLAALSKSFERFREAGRSAELDEALQRWHQDEPEVIGFARARAAQAGLAGRLEEAIAAVEVPGDGPDAGETRLWAAMGWIERGELGRARRCIDEARRQLDLRQRADALHAELQHDVLRGTPEEVLAGLRHELDDPEHRPDLTPYLPTFERIERAIVGRVDRVRRRARLRQGFDEPLELDATAIVCVHDLPALLDRARASGELARLHDGARAQHLRHPDDRELLLFLALVEWARGSPVSAVQRARSWEHRVPAEDFDARRPCLGWIVEAAGDAASSRGYAADLALRVYRDAVRRGCSAEREQMLKAAVRARAAEAAPGWPARLAAQVRDASAESSGYPQLSPRDQAVLRVDALRDALLLLAPEERAPLVLPLVLNIAEEAGQHASRPLDLDADRLTDGVADALEHVPSADLPGLQRALRSLLFADGEEAAPRLPADPGGRRDRSQDPVLALWALVAQHRGELAALRTWADSHPRWDEEGMRLIRAFLAASARDEAGWRPLARSLIGEFEAEMAWNTAFELDRQLAFRRELAELKRRFGEEQGTAKAVTALRIARREADLGHGTLAVVHLQRALPLAMETLHRHLLETYLAHSASRESQRVAAELISALRAPNEAGWSICTAVAQLRRGQDELALAGLRRELPTLPEPIPAATLFLALAEARVGEPAEARRLLQEAEATAPATPEVAQLRDEVRAALAPR